MPLDKSGSKESVGNNIRMELEAKKPKKQAIAIALDIKRKSPTIKPPKNFTRKK